jgi:hypothetical protein
MSMRYGIMATLVILASGGLVAMLIVTQPG